MVSMRGRIDKSESENKTCKYRSGKVGLMIKLSEIEKRRAGEKDDKSFHLKEIAADKIAYLNKKCRLHRYLLNIVLGDTN